MAEKSPAGDDAARRLLPVVWPGTRHDKAESGRREEAVA